jgi:hypothetical protein
MDVATSFLPVLQVFAAEMTRPTFQNLLILISGWLLAPRRTIIGMVRASGTDRHHAAFHRLFSAARWSVDAVGLAIFDLVTAAMPIVFLTIDDTLIPRTGLKIFGTGMHRDPLLSSRGHVVTRWGHCWVVLCVVRESRHFPGHHFSLPVLCRLYLNKTSAQKWNRAYRKKSQLMLEMLQVLNRHCSGTGKILHLLGDSAFTAPDLLQQMPAGLQVTGRVVSNVRLHEPPAPRRPGQNGRPRLRGERLPTPQEMLQQKGLGRLTLKLFAGRAYHLRVATQVCQFYKAPGRDVLVIAVEHLRGGRGTEVFYTTDLSADVETVLRRYSWRWSIELTFHDTKQHLGIEEPQNRTRPAAQRTAPMALLLYSLIVWWHEQVREQPAPALLSWRGKSRPSFADMLSALRAEGLQNISSDGFSTPPLPPNIQKLIQHLTKLFQLAT